jgi:CHAT domain-containing protein/Tfp pilus assembly protein PilF
MKRLWRGVGIVACVIVGSFARAPQPSERPYQRAVREFRNGNIEEALRHAQRAAHGCAPGSECFWRARLLEAELLDYQDHRDDALEILKEPIPETGTYAPLAAVRYALQADMTRGPEAYRLYDEAHNLALAARADDIRLDIGARRAQRFYSSGEPKRAEASFRRVLAESLELGDYYNQAIAYLGLGTVRLGSSRFDEAVPFFQRAAEAAQKAEAKRLISASYLNLGSCYSYLGSFDEAQESRSRGLQLLGDNVPVNYRIRFLDALGSTSLSKGDTAKAIEYYKQALELTRSEFQRPRLYGNLAGAYIDSGDWDHAEKANAEALKLANESRARKWLRLNEAAIALGRGDTEASLSLYRRLIDETVDNPGILWSAHAGLAEAYARMRDYRNANREFAATVKIIDQNLAAISREDYQISFFSLLVVFYQNYVNALVDQHAYDEALEVADSSRARLLQERLKLQGSRRAATTRDFRRLAAENRSTLLYYWIAPQGSYLWVITPERVLPPIKLPTSAQIKSWVDSYRTFVVSRVGDPLATRNEAGHQLYQSLIAPARQWIAPGSKIILVPDGPLNWLNFETLPVYTSDPHYFLNDVEISVAPSLGILTSAGKGKRRVPQSMVIFGDPFPPGTEFPKLAYAAEEIGRIQRSFSGEEQVFTGAGANPEAYRRSEPGRFDVVHFSAHAVANEQSPLDSSIILSPVGDAFKLYARDIKSTPLKAGLVTISACRSAGARSYSGEGLVGFAWAFLQAGAQDVIAGLWDVADSSTPEIMEVLYGRLAAGDTPPAALRKAKLSLLAQKGSFRKPFYWGPFQVYVRQI